jgi:hypothetical protein
MQVGVEGSATSVAVAVPNGAVTETLRTGETLYLSWRSDGVVLLPPE